MGIVFNTRPSWGASAVVARRRWRRLLGDLGVLGILRSRRKILKFPKTPIIPITLFVLFHYLYLRFTQASAACRSVARACFDLFILILFRSLRPFGRLLFVA